MHMTSTNKDTELSGRGLEGEPVLKGVHACPGIDPCLVSLADSGTKKGIALHELERTIRRLLESGRINDRLSNNRNNKRCGSQPGSIEIDLIAMIRDRKSGR
jgi:hypothetical protein